MSDVYLSVVLAGEAGEAAVEATRKAWIAGLHVPSEVLVSSSRNAGILQACGQFVVATMAGVIPSAGVIALANAHALEDGAIYRADVLEESAGERRLWTREGCSRVSADGVRLPNDEDIYAGDGSVELGKGWFPVESDGCYRWIESEAEFEIVRPDWALPELVMDVESGPSAGGPLAVEIVNDAGAVRLAATIAGRCRITVRLPGDLLRERLRLRIAGGRLALESDLRLLNLRVWDLRWRSLWESAVARIILQGLGSRNGENTYLDVRDFKVEHLGRGEFSLSLRYRMGAAGPPVDSLDFVQVSEARVWGASAGLPASEFLHVNGADDFVILSRARWMALRGWPEIRIATEFVETLFCYSAHYAGLREVILPEPVVRPARAVSAASGDEAVDEARVRGWVTQMRRLGAPMIFNRGDWGK